LKPGTWNLVVRWWRVSALALLTGCGSDDEPRAASDREQVEAAATGYLDAFADGDGKEACRHVAERAQRDMATITDAPSCVDAIEKLHDVLDDQQRDKLRDSRVASIRIDGARARVTIAGADTITFEKVDGGWKVAAFASGGGFRTRAEGECIIGGMDAFNDGGAHAFWRREGRADFRDFLVETCRRAERQGIPTDVGGEAEQRAFNRIAGDVIAEMVERGQIRDPR
jgi:hypothetical protein